MASLAQWWVWVNPRRLWRTGEAWHAAVHGVTKNQTQLSYWTTIGNAETCESKNSNISCSLLWNNTKIPMSFEIETFKTNGNFYMNALRDHTLKCNFKLKNISTHIRVIDFNSQEYFIVFSWKFYTNFPLLEFPKASWSPCLPNPQDYSQIMPRGRQ